MGVYSLGMDTRRQEMENEMRRAAEAAADEYARFEIEAENGWLRAAEYDGEAADEMHRQDGEAR